MFPPDTQPETLHSLAADADVIVGWRPDEVTLGAARRLKLFINPGAVAPAHGRSSFAILELDEKVVPRIIELDH